MRQVQLAFSVQSPRGGKVDHSLWRRGDAAPAAEYLTIDWLRLFLLKCGGKLSSCPSVVICAVQPGVP